MELLFLSYFELLFTISIFFYQCWIHEYFSTIGMRAMSGINCDDLNAPAPRAARWKVKQGDKKVDELRSIIDDLTPDDVIWRPFEGHRNIIPFDTICLYSGCLRWCGTTVPYLPERCIRQFGYIQYIPPPPPVIAIADVDSDWIDYHSSVERVLEPARIARYAWEVAPDYLPWYYQVSHPRLCRPVDGPHGPPPVPEWQLPFAPEWQPPYQHDAQDVPIHDAQEVPIHDARERLAAIASEIEHGLEVCDAGRDEPQFVSFFRALDLSRGADLH
jgi:hypothetical protein